MKLNQHFIAFFAVCLCMSAHGQSIIINEFQSNNVSTLQDGSGAYEDWIEIKNTTDTTIDLSEWSLTDSLNWSDQWVFQSAPEFILASGDIVLLYADGDTTEGHLHTNFRISSNGETLGLYNDQGDLITSVTFGVIPADYSMAWIDGAYQITNKPTPNAENESRFDYTDKVVLNEFMVRNDISYADEHGLYSDWVEIRNSSDETLDLTGVFLSDDINDLGQFNLTGTLTAGAYAIYFADDSVELGTKHMPFKLSGDGETLYLSQGGGSGFELLDSVTYIPQFTDVSYGRTLDTGAWVFMPHYSPGAKNRTQTPNLKGKLYLNELMADNDSVVFDAFGDDDDWVELFNASDESIDFGGLFLSDTVGNLTKWKISAAFSDSTTIAAGEFALIYADNTPEQGVLHTSYGLSSSGEEVSLVQLVGQELVVLDSIHFVEVVENMSLGRNEDGSGEWEWQTCYTPKGMNHPMQPTLAGKLFINEFMASNDEHSYDEFQEFDDWLELYNASDDWIDLSGLLISDTLYNWDKHVMACDEDLLLGPGEYKVLWADGTPEQGVNHLDVGYSTTHEYVVVSQIIGMDTVLIDSVSYPEQYADISYGRTTDGGSTWKYFSTPTQGNSNVVASLAENATMPFNWTQSAASLVFTSISPLSITIYSLSGQVLTQNNGIANQVDLTGLSNGAYIAHITDGADVGVIRFNIVR